MYKQSQKENSKRFIRTFILAIIATSLSAISYSQSLSPDTLNKEISVKYLGTEEDMIFVGVKYNNITSSKFVLSIYNVDGEVVYRDIYTTKNFEKKFKIPKAHGKLNFVFSGVHDKLSRSYEIYNTSRVVEDMVVTKIY